MVTLMKNKCAGCEGDGMCNCRTKDSSSIIGYVDISLCVGDQCIYTSEPVNLPCPENSLDTDEASCIRTYVDQILRY
jgi:hypothetical protein